MGWLHDTRPETMPNHGAYHRLGIQLVDDLHAFGNPGQARRSGDLKAPGVARHRPANQSRKSDHGGDHEHAFEGTADRGNTDQSERVSEAHHSYCGAVNSWRAVEADSHRRVS